MTTATKTTLSAGALIRGVIRRGLFDLIAEDITFVEHKSFLDSTFVITVPDEAIDTYNRFLRNVNYTFTDRDHSTTVDRDGYRAMKRVAKPVGISLAKTKLAKNSYRVEARCSDSRWDELTGK